MGDQEEGRERWSSKLAFYMAAIGAAVGFGNVWRFPSLAADYGGGAFFVPYLMALFLIGIPMTILELSLGQFYQTGDVGVFGIFHRRFRGKGVTSVSAAYMVITYYAVLIGWVINGFFDSFRDEAPWDKEGTTGEQAVAYFVTEVIGASTLGDAGRPTRLVAANVGYTAVAWFLIWACLAGGTKWTGRISYFTMGLPIVLLFVFLGRAVTLSNSSDGIEQYIGKWDMDVLTDRPDVWSTAVSQIFFSIGVTFGYLTAFGSYNERSEPALVHSFVIAGSNSMFSFIGGFAVFAALGHLAALEGRDISEIPYGGFSLVFGTWPVVMGTLPGGIHWVRLLFFDLFLLGIDSGFGLLEGTLTAAADTVYLSKFSKSTLAGVMCFCGFLFSLLYCTDAGLNFLDATDFYINFVMLFVGFLEAFGAGWIYGLEDQVKELGAPAVMSWFFANFGAIIVACGFWFGIETNQTAVTTGFVALFSIFILGTGASFYFLKEKMTENPGKWGSTNEAFYELALGNVMHLRSQLSETVGYLPWIWAFMIKMFLPHVIFILFINLAQSTTATGESLFGHYGGYEQWPFQVVGYLCVLFAGFLFLFGAFNPEAYSGLALVDEKTYFHDATQKSLEDDDKKEQVEEGELFA